MAANQSAWGALSQQEAGQVVRANASGRVPVVFLHGLWLLPASWARWAEVFEAAGYCPITAHWPGDPDSVALAQEHPQAHAEGTVARVFDHMAALVGRLERMPVLVGHSMGGLLAQVLAGRGLSAATVAIAAVPFRGVLPLPFAALKSAWPVLAHPVSRLHAVALTPAEFRATLANAVDEAQADRLYEQFAVPAPTAAVLQAATANLNPWTEARVDVHNPERGPLLLMAGELDRTVPWAVTQASFRHQLANPGLTEIAVLKGRGHSLTIDDGWREVAEVALSFLHRVAPAQ